MERPRRGRLPQLRRHRRADEVRLRLPGTGFDGTTSAREPGRPTTTSTSSTGRRLRLLLPRVTGLERRGTGADRAHRHLLLLCPAGGFAYIAITACGRERDRRRRARGDDERCRNRVFAESVQRDGPAGRPQQRGGHIGRSRRAGPGYHDRRLQLRRPDQRRADEARPLGGGLLGKHHLRPRLFNGTSSATPVTAGAAALALSGGAANSPQSLKSFLISSTVDRGAGGPDNIYGAGELSLPNPPSQAGERRWWTPCAAAANGAIMRGCATS